MAELPVLRELGAHAQRQVSVLIPERRLSSLNIPGYHQEPPPSPLRTERGAGRGNCGDHGVTDRAPQEGQRLGQLSQRTVARFKIPLMGGERGRGACLWVTKLGGVPRQPVGTQQGRPPACGEPLYLV